MTTANHEEVASIGEVAGCVWTYLDQHGPVSLSQLVKDLEAPRDTVMQGVGWLAREGKVSITKESRSRIISLT
ncbi:MAG: winged helix-turn-helix domain-containing protein [Planctomycetaceae bacterium]|nr:winged helix-turn-helix domain-containing protein [Planctomycetaceae bacterium]